ncbi:MAG: hypothetical protein ACTSRK_06585 [Promethearchaeota archaeon]
MFTYPSNSAQPKSNCVRCGAPSKWVCLGCHEWYCEKCAPHGLCHEHFGMLDHEDQEAVKRVMTFLTKKFIKRILIIISIIIPVIIGLYVLTELYPVNADWFWVALVILSLGILIIPLIITLFPLMKDFPRLKNIARKYNFSGSPVTSSTGINSPNTGFTHNKFGRIEFPDASYTGVADTGSAPPRAAKLSPKTLRLMITFTLIITVLFAVYQLS